MIWHLWWVWVAGAAALALIELLVPGYFFLGFAFGALATALLVGFGVAPAAAAPILAIFVAASVLGWFVLRHVAGVRPGQVKVWRRDINDD